MVCREQLELVVQDINEAVYRLLPNVNGSLAVPEPRLG